MEEFKFDTMPQFMPASKDETLHRMAVQQGCSFVSSTSSMSQSMSSIYFVLSRMKPLNLECLSAAFSEEPKTYTVLTRSPCAVLLRPHGPNLRSIVVEKVEEPETVLQAMGQVMERLLTEPKDNFARMLKSSSEAPQVRPSEAYSYMAVGNVLLRSQLDCQDPRLPKRTFDLKTRAALPVRMDVYNFEKYRDYHIVANHGLFNSFEREYFDMCRSAFLKYKCASSVASSYCCSSLCSFQVRIGDMDGIFVAYHNASELFGFQYISREEMDERIFGNPETGDAIFDIILQVYNEILAAITPLYPREHIIRLTFFPDKIGHRLTVFSEDLGMHESPVHGKNVRQFAITMHSSLNGFRTDQILLDASGRDEWTVSLNISQQQVHKSEFDAARTKATIGRSGDGDDREMPLIRTIKNRMLARERTGTAMPEIVAPWALSRVQ